MAKKIKYKEYPEGLRRLYMIYKVNHPNLTFEMWLTQNNYLNDNI